MKIIQLIVMSAFILLIGGCAWLLPTVQETTESPWYNFDEAKRAFDQIVPNKTTKVDLKNLGFDPFDMPNVKLITYLDITQKFIPNQSIALEDLDPNIRNCLAVKNDCYGYEVMPQVLKSERYGNVVLDLLNFRRQTKTSGWLFSALIVLQNNLVVYKLWGGEPMVLKYEDKKNPLGPLQDIGKIIDFGTVKLH